MTKQLDLLAFLDEKTKQTHPDCETFTLPNDELVSRPSIYRMFDRLVSHCNNNRRQSSREVQS